MTPLTTTSRLRSDVASLYKYLSAVARSFAAGSRPRSPPRRRAAQAGFAVGLSRFRRGRLWVGVAAAVLLAGTVAAGGTLFNQLIRGAPLLEDVWGRATKIGQSTTDAGYTIVLERAAADSERVWVALSVTAEPRTGADVGRMRVTDANGVVMDGGTGVGTGEVRGVSASLFGFKVPDRITPTVPSPSR